MSLIHNPMKVPELDLKPEPTGGVELSENMQQTLALMTAFWKNQRILLKASPSGILFNASPRIRDIVHYTGVGANDTQIGGDIPCTELLVMGHPDNTGLIWVRPDAVATANNAWPLAANDVISFTLENLRQLNMLIVVDAEKVVVAYSI